MVSGSWYLVAGSVLPLILMLEIVYEGFFIELTEAYLRYNKTFVQFIYQVYFASICVSCIFNQTKHIKIKHVFPTLKNNSVYASISRRYVWRAQLSLISI